ncbi:hypothetical protein FA13DRAFT_255647 [Coprinellus micaceus]|uniref:Uncharacterized protein n=1 Tax=Coprinellus micaceus TaxID=71717 RepID=A0A4Y7TES5_COPMI|nr:hypothetical protein FA13DRAFT_255647 [Coprinellus micaceus]
MSRREAVPLPVIPSLPATRAAARAAGWRWAGPTQEDLREMGGWCVWGRRGVWGEREGEAEAVQVQVQVQVRQGAGGAEGAGGAGGDGEETIGGIKAKVDEKLGWYSDSQRWDVDWWRMRLCAGTEWQNKHSSSPSFPPYSPSHSPPSPYPLYKHPHLSRAQRTGRVYERGMLTGLWQGYMHMPNEASLSYVANTRQFPSNFGEQALGVMMRPVLVRLAEHAWVARPGDGGRLGEEELGEEEGKGRKKGGKGKRYWERGMVSEGNADEEGEGEYEYLEPSGEGPVPIAKPTTMTKRVLVPDDYAQGKGKGEMDSAAVVDPMPGVARVGFLDENMNNAWFPGPVGSLRWEEGALVATTTPEGTMRQVSPEEGVEDGVWRDRYVEQWKGEGGERLKMRSVTFRIPGTFERGEGVEVVSTPHPPAVGVAAPSQSKLASLRPLHLLRRHHPQTRVGPRVSLQGWITRTSLSLMRYLCRRRPPVSVRSGKLSRLRCTCMRPTTPAGCGRACMSGWRGRRGRRVAGCGGIRSRGGSSPTPIPTRGVSSVGNASGL